VTSAENKPAKPARRRYILLFGVIVLVIAGWTAAWAYGRSVLADQLDRQIAGMAERGLQISCADRTIAGFPFRYEVGCRDMRSLDRAGSEASLGGLNAVALVYKPWHVIFEAKSPASMEIPLTGVSGDVSWDVARASMTFANGSLGELDAVVARPEAAVENAFSAGLFSADKAEVHLREVPDQAGALEGFVSVNALKLKSFPELQETVDLRGQVQVTGGEALLAGADLVSLVRMNDDELPVKLVLLEAGLGESRVGASGDLLVNGDGTLSGTLDVTLGNANALLQSLKPLFPPENQTFALMENVVKGLEPAATEIDGVPSIKLPVVIDRGTVRAGFLPLGRIPPLFQAGI